MPRPPSGGRSRQPPSVYRRRRITALLVLVGTVVFGVFVVRSLGSSAPAPWNLKVTVAETDEDLSRHMSAMPSRLFTVKPPGDVPVIRVRDGVRYQRIQGVGGAMTDSSAYLMSKDLSSSARSTLLTKLFSPSEGGLSFLRLPIAASDYTASDEPYSYDDLPSGESDPSLAHFSVTHDDAYIVPAVQAALKANSLTKVIATAWTPPPWMKTNRAYNNLGFSGHLLPGDWPVLAQYFVKFVKAYEKRGIPIEAVSPQNEPRAPATYPSMSFAVENEAKWVAQDLRPALKRAKLATKVFGGEVSLNAADYLLDLARVPKSGLDGITAHCYHGDPSVLSQLHAINPKLRLVISECANNLTPYSPTEIVIGAMRNWASAVALWNLALDAGGGPVLKPNTGCGNCKGIVTINRETHAVEYRLPYYQLAQVGRFIKPGAQRIDTNHFVSYFNGGGSHYGASAGLDDMAVRNPDGSLALVAYNNTATTARFAIEWKGRYITYQLPAYGTASFSWNH